MRFADYRQADDEVRGRLARTNLRLFYALGIVRFGGAMALVLTIADVAPWSLGAWQGAPVTRLAFILVWAVVMTVWSRGRVRAAASDRTRIESAG